MTIKRLLFLIAGCVCLALGCLGVVLPMLPTVPFFLATAFCFSQSSKRLHDWFVGTGLYKKHLESFVKKEGMTVRTKAAILISVTLFMGIAFFAMHDLLAGRIILAVVWAIHLYYFLFRVKTIRSE